MKNSIILSALCAFFISSAFADSQKQNLADKTKELIKQDRQAQAEQRAKDAEKYIIKLLTK